ncbi:hypothetical protein [Oryzisolibacter propanilivorax]|uniref:hypothetical protein n=1 Tax=Oryzisolibacter propanilivorax TaxID=1527607 RepID=UPI0011133F5F|nr:hypothetical protein [Oryzisolibacter propanilivorax]
MLEPIVGFFDKLIDQFTWRRLVFLAVFLVIAGGGLSVFEIYTQSFKLARIEKQVVLLEKLASSSSKQEIKTNPELHALASSLIMQLRATDVSVPVSYQLLPWTKKALAAAAAWFIFGLFILLIPNNYTRTKPETASVFAGMTVVASPFIALSTAIPTSPWLNYAIYPIGHIFVIIFFLLVVGLYIAKKSSRRKQSSA